MYSIIFNLNLIIKKKTPKEHECKKGNVRSIKLLDIKNFILWTV